MMRPRYRIILRLHTIAPACYEGPDFDNFRNNEKAQNASAAGKMMRIVITARLDRSATARATWAAVISAKRIPVVTR